MKGWKGLMKKAVVAWLRKHIGIYLLTLVELSNSLTQETSLRVVFYKEVNLISKDSVRRGCNDVRVFPPYSQDLSQETRIWGSITAGWSKFLNQLHFRLCKNTL
jgi:acid phosphatase class B